MKVFEYLCPACGTGEERGQHDLALVCGECGAPMRRTWTVNFARVPGGGR